MPEPICRIISASAGTGKTYRLSLEYIAILIQYYGVEDFRIDNILALTFTRKATAEIRARIFLQLELLLNPSPKKPDDKANLIKNLRKLVSGDAAELSIEEQNRILSAYREIGCDSSKLQVMTIDAYIGSIFRNIVRPMRNIERFDIDNQAVAKRMPFLLDHLMQPEFRQRLNKLLSREVRRSLDSYEKFFTSLVNSRWLYYMILRRIDAQALPGEKRVMDIVPSPDPHPELEAFYAQMQSFITILSELRMAEGKDFAEDLLNIDFRRLSDAGNGGWSAILSTIRKVGTSLNLAERMLNVLSGKNIWNGKSISGKKYPEATQQLGEAQAEAKRHLANYLMEKLYIPEQQEIIDIWSIILKEYDRLIYRYKNMTYNDISWFSFEALFSEEPQIFDPQSEVSATEFYQFLSHRTRFLLIDEFQDTSLIQFNILHPIIAELTSGEGSKPFQGLIVVGDEKQSIFGWRGGERDLLLNLPHIFGPLQHLSLERLGHSWRCPPSLMSFINRIFQSSAIHNFLEENTLRWDYEPIHSPNADLEKEVELSFCLQNYSRVDSSGLATGEVYADFVHRMVAPALKEDPHGSIAILCRKGSDLAKIQTVLDEMQISNLYQPDRSIGEHPLVSPLLSWLRFVAWGDWGDLLSCLRSDYLRISTPLLKAAVDIIAAYERDKNPAEPHACDFRDLPLLQHYVSLAAMQRGLLPSHICQSFIDLALPQMKPSQRDLLNLHHFINILTDWELTIASDASSIPQLLLYLSENSSDEDLKQASISTEEGLQLLTIHKSKGLEFRRVFLFYDLSARHADDGQQLSWSLAYRGQDFHFLQDYALSLHYDKILKASDYRGLWETGERRAILEEMNTLYVALTRAKSKLHIYFCYQNQKPWPEYLEKREKLNLPLLLCDACNSFFSEKGSPRLAQDAFPEADEDAIPSAHQQDILQYRGDYFQAPEAPATKAAEAISKPGPQSGWQLPREFPYQTKPEFREMAAQIENLNLNWKQVWLQDQASIIGELLHYHLSFIIRNENREHDYAHRRALALYGSLLPVEAIRAAMDTCRSFCAQNPWLFEDKWDYIRTELELKTSAGLIRIDRLMLSKNSKEALIVDYKSGGIHDPLQLEKYKQAVSGLRALADFHIATRFCKV
ncbi:MAG: UvrD-helicase domain-containing protein [Candidatus Cloacimonetes bacterium]|nr:UvrD-helicase domain-containing protein [Candidatus Cloacimonadota bacterium]